MEVVPQNAFVTVLSDTEEHKKPSCVQMVILESTAAHLLLLSSRINK